MEPPLTDNKKLIRLQGFTVLEVLVALVIFVGITATVMYGLQAADRIKGHGSGVLYATRLAENEIEHIRLIAENSDTIADTSYSGNVQGRSFSVERHLIVSDGDTSATLINAPWELQVAVKDTATDLRLVFHFLQERMKQ